MKNAVRELRLHLGWTQQELGARVGTSRQAIIAIENGRFDPSLPLAIKLSRVLKKSIEEIFFFDD
ncbi:MAG TPA: helix-turn-helix transcriptional regulator [Candidatus Elarobacter sp.]|nr:helix-turn-helix transcriptional regulator [Candidatus Elarobacter sp.]